MSRIRERRVAHRILVGIPEGRSYLKDQGVDEMIILKWVFRKWYVGGMDWIDLAQDRDKWLALVNAVMNLRVP